MSYKHTFIDLFSGCGGLSEGFYKQGFRPLAHVERDHYSCQSLRTRMKYYGFSEKNINVIEKDITDQNILQTIKKIINNSKIDVILGGPPCQSFSSLGRAKDENSMKYDPRNYLFESYKKILDYFKPSIFLFENVTGLLTAKFNGKKVIDIIIKKLGKNYIISNDVSKMVLNSVEYGVPQIRKRVFLIGIKKGINYDINRIFNNIIKTHYAPNAKKNEQLKKLLTGRL